MSNKFLTELKLTEPASTTTYYLLNKLIFQHKSLSPKKSSIPQINNLSEILLAYPDLKILIRGHTDSGGQPNFNQQLSLSRANSIKAILVKKGIAKKRIQTKGLGEKSPLFSNAIYQSRIKNRRVDISIIR